MKIIMNNYIVILLSYSYIDLYILIFHNTCLKSFGLNLVRFSNWNKAQICSLFILEFIYNPNLKEAIPPCNTTIVLKYRKLYYF